MSNYTVHGRDYEVVNYTLGQGSQLSQPHTDQYYIVETTNSCGQHEYNIAVTQTSVFEYGDNVAVSSNISVAHLNSSLNITESFNFISNISGKGRVTEGFTADNSDLNINLYASDTFFNDDDSTRQFAHDHESNQTLASSWMFETDGYAWMITTQGPRHAVETNVQLAMNLDGNGNLQAPLSDSIHNASHPSSLLVLRQEQEGDLQHFGLSIKDASENSSSTDLGTAINLWLEANSTGSQDLQINLEQDVNEIIFDHLDNLLDSDGSFELVPTFNRGFDHAAFTDLLNSYANSIDADSSIFNTLDDLSDDSIDNIYVIGTRDSSAIGYSSYTVPGQDFIDIIQLLEAQAENNNQDADVADSTTTDTVTTDTVVIDTTADFVAPVTDSSMQQIDDITAHTVMIDIN